MTDEEKKLAAEAVEHYRGHFAQYPHLAESDMSREGQRMYYKLTELLKKLEAE